VEVQLRSHGRYQVLELHGAVGSDDRQRLREGFFDAIERGSNLFVLNLSHARTMDSLALGEMVACAKRARERGGDLKLVVVPDGIVHALLQLTGLDRVFEIFGDEGEALLSYRDPTDE
jgi:anti-anti-sigma factor